MLFKTGEDTNGTRGHGFTDKPWGKRARELVGSTKRLKDSNWARIDEEASIYIQSLDHDSEDGDRDGEDDAEVDMRANIDIDWYVPSQ